MTIEQKQCFWRFAMDTHISEFHHGDCIGADKEAHDIMVHEHHIVIHPPSNPKKRAFCQGEHFCIEYRKPKDYISRNHDIVDETDMLIACPCGHSEVIRSGTWATIRYATKRGKLVFIIYPDGTISYRNRLTTDKQLTCPYFY